MSALYRYSKPGKKARQASSFPERTSGIVINGTKPLAIDLFCGLGGFSEGFIAEGWDCIGFDIEQHIYGEERYPGQLVVQDVLTLHGSQFATADCIVASPPCQEYSYMAMPWSLAKAKAAAIRADETGDSLMRLNRLFNACFRIQREACEAAGRHVPMVVENVRGAIPWVGRSRWNFGSFHIWGDVLALMPPTSQGRKVPGMGAGWVHPSDPRHQPGLAFNPAAQGARVRAELEGRKNGNVGGGSWFAIGSPGQTVVGANPDGRKVPGFRFDGSGKSFQTASVEGMKAPGAPHIRDGERSTRHLTNPAEHGLKHGGDWFSDPSSPSSPSRQGGQVKAVAEGRKGAGAGAEWFDGNLCVKSSNSPARKRASAMIAKIPEVLSRHIARVYHPRGGALTERTDRD